LACRRPVVTPPLNVGLIQVLEGEVVLIKPGQQVSGTAEAAFGGPDLRFGKAAGALVVTLCTAQDPPSAVGEEQMSMAGWS
jgi:hypothetical protein